MLSELVESAHAHYHELQEDFETNHQQLLEAADTALSTILAQLSDLTVTLTELPVVEVVEEAVIPEMDEVLDIIEDEEVLEENSDFFKPSLLATAFVGATALAALVMTIWPIF